MNSDQYARLLTDFLTEPGALSIDDLLERIDQQVADDEPAAREWIAAVGRVRQAGLLTGEQADGLMLEIVFSRNGDEDEKAQLLSSLGYDALAHGTRTGKWAFYIEARKAFNDLTNRFHEGQRASTVNDSSRNADDAGTAAARRAMKRELYDEAYADELEQRVDGWRRAVKGKDGWTVAVALAFDYIAATDNEDGAGDLRIAAIRRAHAEGVLGQDLTWLLLERMAEAIVSSALRSDSVLKQLGERKHEEEFEGGGPTDVWSPGSSKGASAAWLALDALEDRRAAVFKGRVLLAAGEEEMVRWMRTRPEEFRRRVQAARKGWEVD